jgi:hypothetical protein
LADITSKARISVSGASSSILFSGMINEEIFLKKASDFIEENSMEYIYLMKINIEGGEYDLLEHLLEVKLINNIQI